MRFTLVLGICAAVSALPLDGSDKSLLSDSTSSGPKLPLYNYRLSNWLEEEVQQEIEDTLNRSPLPEADKVALNAAN
ncbi:hypothetical protein E4U34_001381 [Claviceps purpurea]|nr:hypothetical protein E4U51_003118 [Claviceps purpurea]KAG6205189.1 hypothetical protein E4U50_004816 [Claviceps purpurea]KAG6222497.1 hypothetical protein E4U34_001381 [Claviceps purpurea]KAG6245797.1 hypothetical protein E4U23_005043 [Claviceps purpurea]KAG6258703.1 hypothetical protein E4U48_000649 [Claviceps purpurea]